MLSGDDCAPPWRPRSGGRHDQGAFQRHGRPELRRVPRARRRLRARRRRQRLCRQGALGRPPRRLSAEAEHARSRQGDHRRQHRALWRDRGRVLFQRRRRRAFRGSQFGRRRRGRGRRQPLLRIHDRRHRRRARRDRQQFRRRHERRRRLRARRERRLPAALQSGHGRSRAVGRRGRRTSKRSSIAAAISKRTASSISCTACRKAMRACCMG